MAGAVSARVFRHLHYRRLSSVRTLEAVGCVVAADGLGNWHCPLKSSTCEPDFYNSREILDFLPLFQIQITNIWVVDNLPKCTFSGRNKGTFTLFYFLYCGKLWVTVQLDVIMPYHVETTKYPRFKKHFVRQFLWRQL
jgi:hypothetical protein